MGVDGYHGSGCSSFRRADALLASIGRGGEELRRIQAEVQFPLTVQSLYTWIGRCINIDGIQNRIPTDILCNYFSTVYRQGANGRTNGIPKEHTGTFLGGMLVSIILPIAGLAYFVFLKVQSPLMMTSEMDVKGEL